MYSNSKKNPVFLALPPFLFAVWLVPYSWLNKNFIVKWLGCGCPTVDELGNALEPAFDANDFTAVFWGVIAILATVMAIVFSKEIESRKLKVLYVIGVFVTSLLIAYFLWQAMLWQ